MNKHMEAEPDSYVEVIKPAGETEQAEEITENGLVLKLRKPFFYNGREFTEIDLTGLEDLSASQLKRAEKEFTSEGNLVAINEMSLGYACIVARFATGLTKEFFDKLPAKDAVALKNIVTSFFFS